MKSSNFEFLRERWPALATLGGFAESYVYSDAASALVKLRAFAENLTRDIYADLALPRPVRATWFDLLDQQAFRTITPAVVLDKLHAIRRHGNKAAHGEPAAPETAEWLVEEAWDLGRWLAVRFEKTDPAGIPAFEKVVAEVATPADREAERSQLADRLRAREEELETVLTELEATRQKVETAERRIDELKGLAGEAGRTADLLEFDEATTRARIIDSLLASAGWDVGPGESSTAQVAKEFEVEGQPTSSGLGYADYVLFDDDGSPLAVIEAKKASIDPERGRKQAELYADGIEAMTGQRPVIYYTNGYDIWLWDDAAGYPPRKVHGYHSPDSLQYMARFQRERRGKLADGSPREAIVNRLYQIEAIKRVAERFDAGHRKALIVQATGTGKTRVAIALAELMIRSGWAKRILFLCDRRELRRQARNAFRDHLPQEPIRVVDSKVTDNATERIFVATYPAMMKAHQAFDVGYFDLVIADESHRSIYNVYGDLFAYFDALQVGLTATPVDFVTRSTFSLFNCEGQLPTSNYDLEQAVEEGYLVPFEVFEHTTAFMREGIRFEGLTAAQIEELEEQGEDPAQFDFDAEQINKAIFNKDTNRAVIRNLMENGLRDGAGQTIGKTIIFARNHEHAVLLGRMFDELYPQYGGKFCQVIDTYDPRAEQLIDDFKGTGTNTDLRIAISVDMLDTGIDVPDIMNLVFAKPVRSPVKFWQMVGRGTRLCPDLLGPGEDKTVFRIFDHWGNFERFEAGYKPAEPRPSKSVLQSMFEARIDLAETALRQNRPDVFDATIALIAQDIADLPENTIAVREKWKERRTALENDRLNRFDPKTVEMLRTTIAPLMQWRDTRGAGEAHKFDLLTARLQKAALGGGGSVDDLRIEYLDRVERLQAHLNPVRERADTIREVRSRTFWDGLEPLELERVRGPLREIMHHRERPGGDDLPARVVDITEEEGGIVSGRRTSFTTVEMKAWKQLVEAELKKHFEDNPVLKRIRAGEPVSERDLDTIVSLVLTQNPDVRREDLETFFAAEAQPLEFTLRSIVGLDEAAVKAKFSRFVLDHPSLTAKQTRFLGLLQSHLARHGLIRIETLYDAPFTVIDADGPEGVFDQPKDIDALMRIVAEFAPPDPSEDTDDRTMH